MKPASQQVLYVGNRDTSSWSLRAFLALHYGGISADVVEIDLKAPDAAERLNEVSPTGLVPALHLGKSVVWDSLAIMEWAAEIAPSLWPAHARRRAVARSIVAEIHGGIPSLRETMPMKWFGRAPVEDWRAHPAAKDISRVEAIWRQFLLGDGATDYLFGERPSLPDLVFVPVASRFRTYGVIFDEPVLEAYAKRLLTLEALNAWFNIPAAAQVRRRPDPEVTESVPPQEPASDDGPGLLERAAAAGIAKSGAVPFEEVVRRAREKRDSGAQSRPLPAPAARRTAKPAHTPDAPPPIFARPPEPPTASPSVPTPSAPVPGGANREANEAEPTRSNWLSGFRGLGWLRRGRRPDAAEDGGLRSPEASTPPTDAEGSAPPSVHRRRPPTRR